MTERNLSTAQAAYAAYAVGDIETTAKAFAPDCMIYGPEAEGDFNVVEWSTRGGFAAYVTQIALYWRLETYELTGLEAKGEWVTALIHIVATNWQSKGGFDGVITGRMRFSDGLVVEYHEDVDTGTLKAAARG